MSNIGWDQAEEAELFPFLRSQGVTGIEVAPTKVWPGWAGLDDEAAKSYAGRLSDEGFKIPSMQAIFYDKNYGSIFDQGNHAKILDHFFFIADIAAAMGVQVVVFGSPTMRQISDLNARDARSIALPLLKTAAQYFNRNHVMLCIEACAEAYQCNFVNRHSELLQLIEDVNEPGFCLHVDSGNLYETREQLAIVLASGIPLKHFHASEPGLASCMRPLVPHAANLTLLRAYEYDYWVSIEVRASAREAQFFTPSNSLWGLITELV